MNRLRLLGVLSSITMVLSLMFLVLFVLDRFNGAMNFLGSELSKWLLAGFILSALALSIACSALVHQVRLKKWQAHIGSQSAEKPRADDDPPSGA